MIQLGRLEEEYDPVARALIQSSINGTTLAIYYITTVNAILLVTETPQLLLILFH